MDDVPCVDGAQLGGVERLSFDHNYGRGWYDYVQASVLRIDI